MTIVTVSCPSKVSINGDGKPGYVVLMVPASTDAEAIDQIFQLDLPEDAKVTEMERINHAVQVGGNIWAKQG